MNGSVPTVSDGFQIRGRLTHLGELKERLNYRVAAVFYIHPPGRPRSIPVRLSSRAAYRAASALLDTDVVCHGRLDHAGWGRVTLRLTYLAPQQHIAHDGSHWTLHHGQRLVARMAMAQSPQDTVQALRALTTLQRTGARYGTPNRLG